MTTDIATLAAAALQNAAARPAPVESPLIRKLFLMMHGSYGSLFVSKFATGEKDSAGKDKGIRAAMLVWGARLERYPADVIEVAMGRLTEAHAKFPPNLPEFIVLCDAAMPRQTYAQAAGLPCLPAPAAAPVVPVVVVLRHDGKDWARKLMARHDRGDRLGYAQLRDARMALGITAPEAVAA